MPEIVFKCPKCSGHVIEEIMVAMTVACDIRISETGTGGISTNYGGQTNEGGHVDRYQCGGCGFTIVSHDPEYEEFTQDGLDENALAQAIGKLNNPSKKQLVMHDELVTRIADQYATLSGQELADEWNRLFPDQVVYDGDSLYWVEE